MKKVYLIRHAVPDFPEGVSMCIGTTDIPLGEAGFSQAAAMAQRLPPVRNVFSSPLRRAMQTAQAIGLPVAALEDLREMHAGLWDGLTFAQIREQFPELYAARSLNPSLPLPEAESNEEGLARFCRGMETAAALTAGDFAVVAHGGVIALFMQKLTGIWQKPDYAEIIALKYQHGNFYTTISTEDKK